MKKRSFKLFACVAALTMAFSLCACGKDSSDKDSDKNTKKTTTEDKKSDDGKFASMEEFASSDEFQSQISAQKSIYESQGMSIDVKGEGNKLIYTFKHGQVTKADADASGLANTLQTGLESQKSTFESIASTLKSGVDVDDPVVVVEYISSDDQLIYKQEFASN